MLGKLSTLENSKKLFTKILHQPTPTQSDAPGGSRVSGCFMNSTSPFPLRVSPKRNVAHNNLLLLPKTPPTDDAMDASACGDCSPSCSPYRHITVESKSNV